MDDVRKVTGVTWFGPGVFELRLERGDLAFVPGDCVALFGADSVVSRPYSVASGVEEDELAFIIRRMPGGEVSDFLAQRKTGDVVRISPPFGWFRPGDPALAGPFVFVATGTGISPFMAHLRSRGTHPPQRLYYGVRKLEDAVAMTWLRERCPLQLAVSREEVPEAHRGRVTELLQHDEINPKAHYFLCGLDAMIDEVTTLLEQAGVPITHIHRECFFNAEYA